MTQAEECAVKHYPHDKFQGELGDSLRFAVMQGYKQASKDLALSIEDIERLHTFLYAVKNNKSGCFTFTRLSDEQYQEVLKRFNAVKK